MWFVEIAEPLLENKLLALANWQYGTVNEMAIECKRPRNRDGPGSWTKDFSDWVGSGTKDVGIETAIYKSSAVAEMGDRGHNRHGSKRGGGQLCPFYREELGPV